MAGARLQAEHGLRDDAHRALGPDEHLLEIKADVVLQQPVHRRQDRAIGQHGLDTQNVIAGHAIAQHLIAAGVGGNHPAQRAGAARAQIDRQHHALIGRRLLGNLKDAACLGRQGGLRHIDRDHAVHPLQRQGNALLDRMRAAAQARKPALRDNRRAGVVADPQRGRHIGGAARPHQRQRRDRRQAGPVGAVTLGHVRTDRDDIGPKLGQKTFRDTHPRSPAFCKIGNTPSQK